MLKFQVFQDGKPAKQFPVRNAYLIGSDGNAMRGDIFFDKGVVFVNKRETGVAAVALQQPVGAMGELTLQTCLLPEREEPYILTLELARHRLMSLYTKSEDWGMFDIKGDHAVSVRMNEARELFVEALCHQGDQPARCDALAVQALEAAIDGSEELALAHADLLLGRRRSTGALPRYILGCGIPLRQTHPRLRDGIVANFDFINLPMPWRLIAPEEGDYRWKVLDEWVAWARKSELPIIAGPIISFDPNHLPDWLFIWEHDYETVRDLIYEHIERVVGHFKDRISTWNVVSGLHINNHFTVAFDQIMDLTRLATMVLKKAQPSAKALIELREPFGEYYGHNQRSIPPMMYADLLIQGSIQFDAFAVKLMMGQPQSGQFVRDLMQISNLLDHFAAMGKNVNLVVSAPSGMVTEEMVQVAENGNPIDPNCGKWRRSWSSTVQGHWLEAVLHVALSKPFIDTVTWHEVADGPDIEMPMGGLITEDLLPKSSLKRMATFRRALSTDAKPLERPLLSDTATA